MRQESLNGTFIGPVIDRLAQGGDPDPGSAVLNHADGLGAIITWEEANIRYLTSYYVTTPMRPAEMQFAVLTRNGEPHLFGGGTPTETERRMPWMKGRVHPSFGAPKVTAKDADDFSILMLVDAVTTLLAEHGVR